MITSMSGLRIKPVILIALLTLLTVGCSTNPVTGRQDFVLMSEAQEIALGRKYSVEILKESPAYENARLAALVQRVGETIAAGSHRSNLIYRFTVLDSKDVNAFALPGGYIYITRGLLAYLNSEAELAAVLGHEIGHVTARHSVRQQSTAMATGLLGAVLAASTGVRGADTLANMAGTALVRGYGREHELEADRLGAGYMAKSGYNPDAMLEVIGVLKNQELFEKSRAEEEDREARSYHGLFSTHPKNDKRLQEIIRTAKTSQYTQGGKINRESFIRALEGLTFGDSEAEGIVRDNRFYHKKLDFRLHFPPGWRIENDASRIVARPRSNDGLIQVTVEERNKKITPREFMRERLGLDRLSKGESFENHGMAGYTAIAETDTPYGQRPVRYTVLYRDKRAFIFAGTAKDSKDPYRYDRQILDTARSFRRLSPQERKLANETKLHIIPATGKIRYRNLAEKSPITNYAESQLRLLNDHYPKGEPRTGQLLKIVR
jgi:predicted Zn-dependent protease